MHACTRTDIDDMVGSVHGVLIVLDHNQCVAQITQTLERIEQLVVVALVQTDGRLVQNIQHAHERRTDLRRQTDALALAARQRTRSTRQGQVFQTDRLQKSQTVQDFLDDTITDLVLHLGQFQIMHEIQCLGDRQFTVLGDVQTAHCDRKNLFFETMAVTVRAENLTHAVLNLGTHVIAVRLVIAAFQIVDDALEWLAHRAARKALDRQFQRFSLGTVQQRVQRIFGEVAQRSIHGEPKALAQCIIVHVRNRARFGVRPARCPDGTLGNGQLAVGNDAVGVNLHLDAQTGTGRAGTIGIVKREHARRQLFDRDAAVLTGIVLGEGQRFPADDIGQHQTARQCGRGLDRVGDTRACVRAHDHTVDHNFNRVLFILLQLDFFGQIVQIAVHPHADIARLTGVIEHLDVFALALAHDRCQNLHFGTLRQAHQLVNNLVNGLLVNLLAALGTVRCADSRPEQTQVVVNLGNRAHRRAWVLGGSFLVDGDSRGQAVDIVYIGLFHLSEELTRIGGQRLDIAALALCVNGIERQRGFTRTR